MIAAPSRRTPESSEALSHIEFSGEIVSSHWETSKESRNDMVATLAGLERYRHDDTVFFVAV